MSATRPALLEATEVPGWREATKPPPLCVQVTSAAVFAQLHLPRAVLVEPTELVAGVPPVPGALPDARRLGALAQRLALAPEQTVLLYDDEGGGWAGRLAWTLDVLGHRRWAYLNGGLHAWHAAGLPVESGAAGRSAEGRGEGTTPPDLDPRPRATREEVLAALGDPDTMIWDVRSAEEYRGERSGSRRAGHIPGAVNMDWELLRNPGDRLRLPEDLLARLAEHGIDAGKRIITHCQSHHRSGLSYLVGRLLGFERLQAYDGSWGEWGNREDTPVVSGPEPGAASP